MKYHINPETGEALKCSAGVKLCPYEGKTVHADSVEEARNLYEQSQQENLFIKNRKNVDEDNTGSEDNNGETVYRIPVSMIDKARSIIDRTNKRLAKQGIDDRFTFSEETVLEEYTDSSGFKRAREYVAFKVEQPSLSYNGYEFLAVVDKEEAGLVTRTAPGVEFGGWRPEKQSCEHCGQSRHRSKTYIIAGPDGKRRQIGSTCVDSYLGIKPEGLWALGFDPLSKLNDNDDFKTESARTTHIETDYTLAMALAVSDNGKNFVSKSIAYDIGLTSTADLVDRALYGSAPIDAEWRTEMMHKADEYVENGRVAEIKKNVAEMEGSNDYVTNLKTIAAGEWVSHKNTGVLISALAAERKAREAKKNAVEWKSGYTAPVGESVKGLKMKVLINDVRETYDPYNYRSNSVLKSRMVFQDEEGHQVVWWASRKIDVEPGTELVLKGGKVKKHETYKGVDQTVLTRVKVDED